MQSCFTTRPGCRSNCDKIAGANGETLWRLREQRISDKRQFR